MPFPTSAAAAWAAEPLPDPETDDARPLDRPTDTFLERVIGFLLPLFLDATGDLIAARIDVLETLSGYPVRGNADLLAAAQVIAFGLSALDNLTHAMAHELSPSQRLRYRGGANALNRSAQQNARRLEPRPAEPAPPQPALNPSEVSDADILAALGQARNIAANPLPSREARPAGRFAISPNPAQRQRETDQLWADAMTRVAQQLTNPDEPRAAFTDRTGSTAK